jgi:hypothetical protein
MREGNLDVGGEATTTSVEFGFAVRPPDEQDQPEAIDAATRQAADVAESLTRYADTARSFADLHSRWRGALVSRLGDDTWNQLMAFSSQRSRPTGGIPGSRRP